MLPYFLHCIASQVDTFVCNAERFVVLLKHAFFLCFSSMHTCLLCVNNYDVHKRMMEMTMARKQRSRTKS